MNNPIIEIRNLEKNFSGFKALKGINLQIDRGEIIGLLGPNGAGKTTTLKILTGLLSADQGSIKIMGSSVNKKLPGWLKAKIGVVFEESNLYLRLNAIDNLKLFAGINNVSKARIAELLSEYKLQDAAKKEVRNFSKGMKKRLMICRALLAEPEILILDEATGGLDPISAEIIRKKVLSLKEEGKTVILSTHYLEEADRLCDRVAFINQGKVLAVNRPSAFKNKLQEKYLELKFLIDPDLDLKEIKKFLEGVLAAKDDYSLQSGVLNLKLNFDQQLFNKAERVAAKFKLLDLKKVEADLQQVFNNFNN
ncbi:MULTISPECIES: ABC transporter ATP-binding protein [Halanaerobium]|jgi:ABC-type multidrug transport system ATPase subunit|uniref:ABC-2 type transport system ATP-binding protein n=1 Tax=Halanaerobium kushneri TaxID=56779 RepID=A0A1N6U5X5_9FIRM|nr:MULTISPECIES: ABC transporter ATP-binding protein [Halanaerobium]PUU94609.1 MAG: antibiotic transport system ATP-binding protein [Halanaerobium sp.]RCW60196.1 ABC-2 type transport system ATP-binding protein [Halanaerobium sp. ST460_2HS_T2]SIQ60706.1 ABC-2 type transport system ATP-binding protein [Halanaerobium kushneri]